MWTKHKTFQFRLKVYLHWPKAFFFLGLCYSLMSTLNSILCEPLCSKRCRFRFGFPSSISKNLKRCSHQAISKVEHDIALSGATFFMFSRQTSESNFSWNLLFTDFISYYCEQKWKTLCFLWDHWYVEIHRSMSPSLSLSRNVNKS